MRVPDAVPRALCHPRGRLPVLRTRTFPRRCPRARTHAPRGGPRADRGAADRAPRTDGGRPPGAPQGGIPAHDPERTRERDWYARNQEYVDRVFQRADLYLFYIVEELEKRDMPAELALLPVIESAFDPFAYSRSRASGLWQIIPGTGRRLGVEQNWWFDGRRDMLESTRAALDYLEEL